MPFGDRTGPAGMGPRTGRGAGYCSGYGMPGYMNRGVGVGYGLGYGWGRGYGRGMGYGRGGGFGWRHIYYATGVHGLGRGGYGGWWGGYAPPVAYPVNTDEATYLKQEADYLEKTLESIKSRLDELAKKENTKED